jgi:hypothetical protein
MQHKSVIFVVISLLIVAALPLTYTTVVTAAPPEQGWHDGQCSPPDIIEDADGAYLGTAYDCCWTETDPADPEQIEIYKCQFCYVPAEGAGGPHCDPPRPGSTAPPTTGENIVPGDTGVLEQPPTFAPFDPTAPLQGGVLEQQEPPTPPTFAPRTSPGVLEQLEQGEGFSPGFLQRQQEQPPPDQGAAELPPPATEETQPATVREEQPVPVCQEGLEFNEDLGFCVPEDCPEGQVLDEESGICVLEEPEAVDEPAQSAPEEEQPSEESDSGDGSNN